MSEKYQYFNGLKYTRDDKTGYYLNSTTRKRIHRAVWEFYKGEIPKGYDVHHKDGDKGNNEIENLEIVLKSAHATLHGKKRAETCYDKMVKNLNENARPKAAEWHRSDAGRRWHSIHGAEVALKQTPKPCKCLNCGKEYLSKAPKISDFCSNACKSAYRRKIGADNVAKICPICGKEFFSNKYAKTATCSRSCANRMRSMARAVKP